MTKFTCRILFLLAVFGMAACTDTNPVNNNTISGSTDTLLFSKLTVPKSFNFETSGDVNLNISDPDEGAFYSVYAYEDAAEYKQITYIDDDGNTITEEVPFADNMNTIKLGSARINSGMAKLNLSVPTNVKSLLLRKYYNGAFVTSFTSDLSAERPYTLNYNGSQLKTGRIVKTNTKGTSLASDVLWCVNGSGQLFTVNPNDLTTVRKQDLAEGTWTVAMDYNNNQFYTIGKNKPYKLYRYDVDVNNDYAVSEPTILNSNLGFGGPRLEYANDEGFLYFSNKNYIYKMNPTDGNVLETFSIDNGLNNTSGGDMAKSADGHWYMSTFGGLYALTFNEGSNVVNAIRESADNLPFTPTSLCIDSKTTPDIWVADNFTPSSLYVMDVNTGGYDARDPDNELAINDLTKTPITYDEVVDTDKDGCPDNIDEFPDNPEICLTTVTPTKYGWGSLAFEDFWPYKGDYDFNDLVVNYRYTLMLNIDNKAVEMEAKFWVRHVTGASYNNGFGIQFDNLTPSQIESVAGTDLRSNTIELAANGLEANQEKAVVVVFDQSQNFRNETTTANPDYNELTVSIRFTQPLSVDAIGSSPFNPFLIVNGDRSREVHLPGSIGSSLAENNFQGDSKNLDPDMNYKTDTGLPWAIAIVHEFKYTKEKVEILKGYNHFKTWAESGGSLKTDWYKDNSGYRNTSMLDL